MNFPNGNHLSTIWGAGSYSENHDREEDWRTTGNMDGFWSSNNVEIMFYCGEKLKKRILRKYNEGGADPIGYLDIQKWSEIVSLLSKEKKSSPPVN